MKLFHSIKKIKNKKKNQEEFPGSLVVKDLALSALWHGFDPWPRNFCVPQA